MERPDDGGRNRDRAESRAPNPDSPPVPSDDADDQGPTAATRNRSPSDEGATIEDDGVVRWLLETDDRTVSVCRDIAMILAIVGAVNMLLFAVSGAWPLLVAVESGSMEPNVQEGDLVFIVDESRFAGANAVEGTGIVPRDIGRQTDHERLGAAGDVIVFIPDGDPTRTPVIHRAHFWVEEGENWVRTKGEFRSLNEVTCAEIVSCPAPHDGFVTKGDANPAYDQLPRSGSDTTVVSPEWITGKAMVRIPWLGQIGLGIDSIRVLTGVGSSAILIATGALALVLLGTVVGDRGP
ncbi:S24/S26 family peptidase [Natrinema ejinorense]|uniref:S26 family signal peptidase n=1 Tax=Natrinema ejinorense TaxID=373386 RepID=A0A2A5QZ15_9EURY|nr:S26 family signal peptidase [Natrinema ejinorense]PCR92085.1 S26 family signal peptidase [Natrinema ejinorense]